MQTSEKKTIDARTFHEIWESLATYEKKDFRVAVISATKVTDVTFYNWAKGATAPTSFLAQKELVKVISKELGINTLPHTLFPTES